MLSNGLTFHPKKSVALNISPFSQKPNPNLTLTLNNDTIDVSNSAKYLSIIVDDQLPFQCHISFLEKSFLAYLVY